MRVNINFYTHVKTLRLKAKIGDAAFWVPPRIWAYAAEHRHNGDLSGHSAQEIAALIAYPGDAKEMLEALLQASFIDPDMKIHNWEEHNGFHATFSRRAKTAARARWKSKESNKENSTEKRGDERRGEETSIATSIAKASTTYKSRPCDTTNFVESLKSEPAYEGINIDREFSKMKVWCTNKKKQPTPSRFIAWLNRIEQPLTANGESIEAIELKVSIHPANPSYKKHNPNCSQEQKLEYKALLSKREGMLK